MTATGLRILTALLLLAAMPFPAHAESLAYRQGRAAAAQGDHQQAYALFSTAARQGDAWSQFGLGVLYLNGDGTAADSARSTHWFQKAANQGLALAQFNLGNAYLHGRGVDPSLTKAAFWWQQAAEQGNADAQGNLGTLMYFDYATEGSKRIGRAWLTLAASRGNETAARQLAQLRDADGDEHGSIWRFDPELSEVRILTMPDDRFGINLFAARQRRSVERFLHEYGLAGRVHIYRFPRDDAFLYGVLYGSYPDRAAARETIREMQPGLRKQGPWPVALGFVQNRIRTVQTRQLESATAAY